MFSTAAMSFVRLNSSKFNAEVPAAVVVAELLFSEIVDIHIAGVERAVREMAAADPFWKAVVAADVAIRSIGFGIG